MQQDHIAEGWQHRADSNVCLADTESCEQGENILFSRSLWAPAVICPARINIQTSIDTDTEVNRFGQAQQQWD